MVLSESVNTLWVGGSGWGGGEDTGGGGCVLCSLISFGRLARDRFLFLFSRMSDGLGILAESLTGLSAPTRIAHQKEHFAILVHFRDYLKKDDQNLLLNRYVITSKFG
jgi:hypothetical protein